MIGAGALLRVGVDLGGTKTEAVVIRAQYAQRRNQGDMPDVLARVRRPTERERGYDHIVFATATLVGDVLREAGLAKDAALPIGIGMPGSWTERRPDGTRSATRLVKNANTTCLNGRPFFDDLQRALGVKVAFANDANCFALAEATWGAAREARVAFGVILGTGVGGGLVLRDERGEARPWEGAQGIAGEWGHVALEPVHGPPCYCGRRGCVETFLSGPAIEAAYLARCGASLSLHEIEARAAAGEDLARTLMAERMELFGRAIATVIDIVDPDVIVLGGGVSKLERLYDEGVRAAARWVFNDTLETRIVRHALGDSAGVLGAALLP